MALQMWIWLALLGLSAALVCPDGGMCEDNNTCCKNTAGGYGCCPLPHAECCSDHLHCCYEGTLCDLVHEKCVNKTVSLPWMTRLPTKEAFLLPQLRQRVKAVVCPDKESECPDGTTCCQLPDSSWACCPLAKAVCCEDKRHCCPEGTKCDLVHSKCVSALLQSFPMLDKFPARKRKNNADVFLGPQFHFPLMKKIPALPNNTPSGGSLMCPDGKSSCPDRTTCCLGHNKGYYCCPAPNAVCCSDNVHCCPGNTTCDMEREVCKPNNIHLPLLKKFPAAVNDAPSGGSVKCPDGKSSCPDGSTCCPAQRGGYYCCPAPDAVCCSDNVHCCPGNTTCDMEHEVCKHNNIHLPLLKKFPAAVNDAPSGGSLMCPDGKSSCPDRTTCCLGHNKGYYCCPAPNAVCCSDNVHCCPGNTTCDMEREVCKPNNIHLPLLKKFPAAVNDAPSGGSVKCPDGKSSCPDGSTCCPAQRGGYYCCPAPDAVCCSDNVHCCPSNTTCDMEHEVCKHNNIHLPLLKKFPAAVNDAPSGGSLMCPDGKSSCPDRTTCCLGHNKGYYCCPAPNAVCCSDNVHCCPGNTTCDMEREVCKPNNIHLPLLKKFPAAVNDAPSGGSVKCPDGKSSCPDGSTCCPAQRGGYYCCPAPDAVCCSDNVHCCPGNTTCDMEHEVCKHNNIHLPLLKKFPAAVNDAPSGGSLMCPDGKSSCPDRTTCCLGHNKGYYCCPAPNAVCCSDNVHCCPGNTTCDMEREVCKPNNIHLPLLKKFPAAVNDAPSGGSVKCPDGKSSCVFAHGVHMVAQKIVNTATELLTAQSQGVTVGAVSCNDSVACADGNTCCKSPRGEWACCPLPQAVCCDDLLHCCPQGTVCNLTTQTCDHPSGFSSSVPWMEKRLALTSDVQDEKCDKETMCPGGTTCCKKDSGQWACCPLPQAVCCSDHEHCCPKGYRCNVAEQTCNRPGGLSEPWRRKIPALQKESVRNMCDAQTSCPRDTTCCFIDSTRKWGCCPLPEAVCCEDGNHCCPSGHTCEPHRSSCSRGLHVIPWVAKVSALTEPAAVTDVKCDDKSSCASGTTCCKLPTGEWGCCPLVKAVCCADHEHCCPQGYTCNMQTGTCEKKQWDALVHAVPQTKVVQPEPRDDGDVPCDAAEEFRCSKQETCCRKSATEWTCCPSPRATCCSDSKHCCPEGYSCDLQAGGCSLQTQLTWDSLLRDRKTDFVPRGL
ncbi:multiple epidermal growth factor-like domains protein 6 isoform X5 [Echeneis naucrates]|uniref:multiple epidermal growth factor-like domains protein 6 isoform X5 n=1 Tax=Echeneis naucrates TaxID=173247 RepID=UPI0011145DC0|nr:multiple epidermal growth factor-like domains protein 6 isoform X5 [Echeneis naucrates]